MFQCVSETFEAISFKGFFTFSSESLFLFRVEYIQASTEKENAKNEGTSENFPFLFSSELHLVQLAKVLSHIVADSCSFNCTCSLGLILMGKIQGTLTIQRLAFDVLRLLGRINQCNLV